MNLLKSSLFQSPRNCNQFAQHLYVIYSSFLMINENHKSTKWDKYHKIKVPLYQRIKVTFSYISSKAPTSPLLHLSLSLPLNHFVLH